MKLALSSYTGRRGEKLQRENKKDGVVTVPSSSACRINFIFAGIIPI
jgi:hypothetical protein